MDDSILDDTIARLEEAIERGQKKRVKEVSGDIRALLTSYRKFRTLYHTGRIVASETDIDRLLRLSLDKVIEVSGAERGMIILADKQGEISFQVARHLSKKEIASPQFEVSRNIINRTLKEGTAVHVPNALQDPELGKKRSVRRLRLLSVLCVPIRLDKGILGVVYVDNRSFSAHFDQDTCDLLSAFADQIAVAVQNALTHTALRRTRDELEAQLRDKYSLKEIVGQHPKIVKILETVVQITDSDATVLLCGESGTGKELVARALHSNSKRRSRPFHAINCAAMAENLLESQLFGHERGAFTGAYKKREGCFATADGGVLFLDQIESTSATLQGELLRVLEFGEFYPLGSDKARKCDVRIIAATNVDLQDMVNRGKFRQDLFYRLKVISLDLPPLRERAEDIPLLIAHFLDKFGQSSGRENMRLSKRAEYLLTQYSFPGNVRELESFIKSGIALAKGEVIDVEHLPKSVVGYQKDLKDGLSLSELKRLAADQVEHDFLIRALTESHGVIRRAARMTGIDIKNFHQKVLKHGIDPQEFSGKTSM